MIYISKFSSLQFHDARNDFEEDKHYKQVFALGDNIYVTLHDESYDAEVLLENMSDGGTVEILTTSTQESARCFCVSDNINYIGEYRLSILAPYDVDKKAVIASVDFSVLMKNCLKDTVKISYTHRRNEYGGLFVADRTSQITYDIRFKGGIIFRENEYLTEDEGYRSQNAAPHLLSAYPHKKCRLTIGDAYGVPEWVGEKLNLIFSLSSVFVNDEKYVRTIGESPERMGIMDYYPLYIWKLSIEPQGSYFDKTLNLDNVLYDNSMNILTDNYGEVLTID